MADFALWATAYDGAMARRRLLVGLLRQPRRGGGRRDRRRSDRRRRARGDGGADGVDGNRPSELLDALAETAGERPSVAGRLRRAATFLRKIGIEIGFGGRQARTRIDPYHATPHRPRQKTSGCNRPHRPHRPSP